MAYSEAYQNNAAWRSWLQSSVSYMLDLRQAGRLSEPSPADLDPNWYPNIIKQFNINGVTYSKDWYEEVTAQKQARGIP